jgi:hypothetical protein
MGESSSQLRRALWLASHMGSRSHASAHPWFDSGGIRRVVFIETHGFSSMDSSASHPLPETLVCLLRLDLYLTLAYHDAIRNFYRLQNGHPRISCLCEHF